MKVALVTSGHENLGIEFISSFVKSRGHDVQLFFDPQIFGGGLFLKISPLQHLFDLQNKIVEKLVHWRPNIVGFSCMTHNYRWSLQVAYKLKERLKNIPIIFGGIHPTSAPKEVLSHSCVDMVAIGEGEVSFAELLDNFDKKKFTTDVKGIYFKVNNKITPNPLYPPIKELDSLPLPDKKIFYNKVPHLRRYYSTIASRGCPFSCSYCCNSLLRKLYKGEQLQRKRSVGNVISELVLAKKHFNIPLICFEDEVFPVDTEWLDEFSKKYKKEIGLPFIINYHFSLLKEEHIRILKSAGCRHLKFGLQSASEKIRTEVCNRVYTNDEVINAAEICKKYGIIISIDHILGLPRESEDDLKQALGLYRKISPDIIYSYWLTYYPGTEIVRIAKDAGILTEEDKKKILTGQDSFYHKGAFTKNKSSFLTYEFLFDLIPLLPQRIHKKLENGKLVLKFIPKGYFLHFFLVFLIVLKSRPGYLFEIMRILFSRKNVP